MTLADIIILLIVGTIVGLVVYMKIKNRKQSSCSSCAYAMKYNKKRKLS